MIVDLIRNDLSRIAAVGSVETKSLFDIETYPSIHQMTSTVAPGLGKGRPAVDVLAALFPCGSVTGAPKIRAMEVIAEIAQEPRGVYNGTIGWVGPGGEGWFKVANRPLGIPEEHGPPRLSRARAPVPE